MCWQIIGPHLLVSSSIPYVLQWKLDTLSLCCITPYRQESWVVYWGDSLQIKLIHAVASPWLGHFWAALEISIQLQVRCSTNVPPFTFFCHVRHLAVKLSINLRHYRLTLQQIYPWPSALDSITSAIDNGKGRWLANENEAAPSYRKPRETNLQCDRDDLDQALCLYRLPSDDHLCCRVSGDLVVQTAVVRQDWTTSCNQSIGDACLG